MPLTIDQLKQLPIFGIVGNSIPQAAFELIMRSPTLLNQIEIYSGEIGIGRTGSIDFHPNGGAGHIEQSFTWGANGNLAGSFQTIRIGLGRMSSPADFVGVLAHELGHYLSAMTDESHRLVALRSALQSTDRENMYRDVCLDSEGRAISNSYNVRREIVEDGGPVIPIGAERAGLDLSSWAARIEDDVDFQRSLAGVGDTTDWVAVKTQALIQFFSDFNAGNEPSGTNFPTYAARCTSIAKQEILKRTNPSPGTGEPVDLDLTFSNSLTQDNGHSWQAHANAGNVEISASSTIDAAGNGSLTATVTGDVTSSTQSWTIGGGTPSDTPNLVLGGAGEVFARTNTELEQAAAALTLRGIAVADGDLIRYIDANQNGALDDGETARVVHGGADGQGYAIDLTANGTNQWDVDNIDLMRLQGGSPTTGTVNLSGLNDALGQSDTASPFTVPSVGAVMGELENLALTLGGVDPTVAKALGILRNAGVSAVQAGTGGGVDAFVGSLAVAGVTTTGSLVGQWFGGELADALGIDRRLVAPVANANVAAVAPHRSAA